MVSQVWTHHFRWGGKLEQSSSHRGSKNQRKRMFLCHPLEMMNRKFLGDLSSFPLILSEIKPMHIVYLFPRFSKASEVGNQNEPWNLSTEKVTFAHCKARTAVGMRHWRGGGRRLSSVLSLSLHKTQASWELWSPGLQDRKWICAFSSKICCRNPVRQRECDSGLCTRECSNLRHPCTIHATQLFPESQ